MKHDVVAWSQCLKHSQAGRHPAAENNRFHTAFKIRQALFERMPVPEANFFGIVIAIQQKSGGNLSEALGNLSKVLRDRKKMAEKIQAMSMEAKASAGIIGSLPPIVMLLVYLSTPEYISLLWTHPTGQLMLCGCAIWMSIGIFVMKKMINFDF